MQDELFLGIGLQQAKRDLIEKGYDILYRSFTQQLQESFFRDPHSIHGVLHTKRVLLLNLLLSARKGFSRKETEVLATVSLFHDIGRTNDGYCTVHGILSWRKLRKMGLWVTESDAADLIKFIIENHCIDDQAALQVLPKYRVSDEERAIELFTVFKDADGLDRVRLGDLSISQLRNEVAKELVPTAEQLYRLNGSLDKVWG